MNWHSMEAREAAKILGSGPEGLSGSEAEKRGKEFGLNVLTGKKRTSLIVRFFMQFNDFMIVILLTAAAVSFGVSLMQGDADFVDPLIIILIVTVNAILGLVQENKAEKALEALKQMSAPTAKLLRDGKLVQVNTEEIVPGDVMVLETGDYVSADGRLLTAVNLQAEEAALTGESLPSEKTAELVLPEDLPLGDRHNMVFSGSSVSRGRGRVLVTETGMRTQMGRIADLLMQEEKPETPLQKKLGETGKTLGVAALAICGVIFVLGLLRQAPPFEMFMTSVSLAVAAMPEGLPAVVTIVLAIGVQRMAGRNAVIRKLPAVETLGGASVICSDKTGTLTQNKMKVTEVWSCENPLDKNIDEKRNVLKLAALCNDAVESETGDIKISGEPTEAALVAAAAECGLKKKELEEELPRIGEIPFDSKRKLMSTLHKEKGGQFLLVTKGAPDILLDRCKYYFEDGQIKHFRLEKRKHALQTNLKMAEKALRVLGVAFKSYPKQPSMGSSEAVESDLVFVGLIGMIDPPREEARQAVAICKQAGIKPVMVTGDQLLTAQAIGRKLGILGPNDLTITGRELNALSPEELNRSIDRYAVFARVTPEHKVRIVKAFQSQGHLVAMTGDGVNDAPALQAADIGCAMGITGTDVAKGAADMVLTDDNFATIVEAVKEGRGIYANIKKAVHFLLSSNIGEIITIFTAIVMGWESPLLAIHLLWVNLVTDSLPAIALGVDPAEQDIMRQKPQNKSRGLFDGGMWERIVFEGCMIGLLALLAFGAGAVFYDGDGLLTGRTMAFATLSLAELVHSFNIRSHKSIFTIDLFDNMYLIGAFILGTFLQVSVISIPTLAKIFKVTPLTPWQWLIVIFLSLLPILIVELEKCRIGREKPAIYPLRAESSR